MAEVAFELDLEGHWEVDCGEKGKETTAWRWAHAGIPGWSSESIGKGGVAFRASPDTVAAAGRSLAGWFLGVPESHPQAPFAGTSHRGTQARGLAAVHGGVCAHHPAGARAVPHSKT